MKKAFYATDVDSFLPYVTIGWEFPLTHDESTVTFKTSSISGSSNIVFKSMFSNIDLNPLAQSFY